MPIRTPHFGLEAFITGDVYSEIVDTRRFTIIDSYMAFVSDLVGPGVISGWNVSFPSPLTFSVSSGWGMIDREIVRTFGDYRKTLLDNNTVYVWMRRRPGVIGKISAFSNIVSVNYIDNTPPSAPSGLFVYTKSFDSITIKWNNNLEQDIFSYKIYRSKDNISYTEVGESFSNSFTEAFLEENTIYYYKIKAIDNSGNESSLSSSLLLVTEKDDEAPANPSDVRITNSNKIVHINWKEASYGNVDVYRIYVTPVNEERIPIGDTFINEVDSLKNNISIENLENGQRYLFVIKSVNKWNIESEGVTRLGFPFDSFGPPDIVNIDVIDYASDSGVSSNGLSISWSSYSDPYMSFEGSSEILIEEYRSDGTVFVSNWIATAAGFPSKSIDIFSYIYNNQTYYKSIESRTLYYITVRNIDELGNRSIGKRISHITKNFQAPSPVQAIYVTEKIDKSLIVRWENSSSEFSYNVIKITDEDSSTFSQTILVDNKSIGKSTFYNFSSSNLESGHNYIFEVYCVDEFENKSESKSVTFEVSELEALPKPPPPKQQTGFASDGQNILQWSAAQSDSVVSYRIYRAIDSASIDSDSFSLLETVPGSVFSYTDYEVENEITYIYFITSVDIFGQESLNPIDDRYINYGLVTLKPSSSLSSLLPPEDLSFVINGSDVQLLWSPTAGQFDGYEIYRSIGNKYSFQLVATVSPSITYYIDESVLNKTAKFYYIVRKFKNESDIYVTETDVNVTNAIYLGKIQTSNGDCSVDTSGVRNILKLEDPVRLETISRISSHKHEYIDEDNDRRINLNNSSIVSDWQTNDNQTYYTNTDISDTTSYSVYINGEDAVNFGFLYSLNKIDGEITFETRLAPTGFELDEYSFPFSEPPVIEIKFNNLEEVSNILPKNRVSDISAQQVKSGTISKNQIFSQNHNGRIKEKLIPIQIETFSIDGGYKYYPVDEEQAIGNAVVFYCIINGKEDSDLLIAGTSDGIYISDNFGVSWERKFETATPVIKFFYSSKYKVYFAATNRGILFSKGNELGDFSIWNEVAGAENSKIIRDICEDENGDVFCSSDLGVYKLRRDIGQGSFYFQQAPIFGPRSTEAYSLFYDSSRSRIIVSNELGIFESYNNGTSWEFSSEFTEQKPIFSFAEYNGYIFAITDYAVWRRSSSSSFFERISFLSDVSKSRKLTIWNDRLYISTDIGLLSTLPSDNIYHADTVSFDYAFSQFTTNRTQLPATSLDIIDEKMFIGSEGKLFVSERPSKINIHWEDNDNVIPTVYINGKEQFIGYRFSTSTDRLRKSICFDIKQKNSSKITIANQYKNYKTVNGGWADLDYLSTASIYVDGKRLNKISISEKPANDIASIILPSYNDRNSHKIGADSAKALFELNKNNLLSVERDSEGVISSLIGFSSKNVTEFIYSAERFLSQIYKSARVIISQDENGVFTEHPFSMPKFRVAMVSSLSNVKTGSFGTYKNWAKDSNIGYFGSEFDSNGFLPSSLISTTSKIDNNGFGVSKYTEPYSAGVGDIFPEDYSSFSVIAVANSYDGTIEFPKELSKYNYLEIDIINSSFSNTGMPHWVIEDTFEWVNSGSPSHLSQVHHANILSSGLLLDRISPGLQEITAESYQCKYNVPCNSEWYDKLNSTIDYDLFLDYGNKGLSIPFVSSVLFVEELNSIFVGGYGGVLSINIVTKDITKIDLESNSLLVIKDIKRNQNLIYILEESCLYIYNITNGKITKDVSLGLPSKLHSFIVLFGTNLVVGADDGIYARKVSSLSWEKVVSTSLPVNVMISPDAGLAISDNGESYYSVDGFNWNRVGVINDKIINKIKKHRSQIFFGTTSGLYQDGGSFYSNNLYLQLLDVLGDIRESASIGINDIDSDFSKAVIGMSDGRYAIYVDDFLVNSSGLETIHKLLVVNSDIWFFGGSYFRVSSESFIRKLATGSKI